MDESPHWRANLIVCLLGSFSTIVAMTMLLPYLPLYVEHLGVHGHAAIERWSGVAYGATFLSAALTAPLWGRLGDRYGRKPMLMRASLGMAIAMSLIGLAQNVEQLVLLRLLTGLLGGYSSGSTIIVAAQTPRARSAWALGVLSTGVLAGTVVGPLIGGFAPGLVGVRTSFLVAGGVIFVAFLLTTFGLREDRTPGRARANGEAVRSASWLPGGRPVALLLVTASLLMFATLSLEPIVTVYIGQLDPGTQHVAALAGIVIAIGALGSIVSAPRVGRLADRLGHQRVITACLSVAAVTLALQSLVENVWQLAALRLAMGLALGGLLPTITAAIRHAVPDGVVGRALGLSVSAQYIGQVLGPLLGGLVAGAFGIRVVFLATAVVLAGGALLSRLGGATPLRYSQSTVSSCE
ncbi:MAG: MFS transporter [Gaiellales bacterium]